MDDLKAKPKTFKPSENISTPSEAATPAADAIADLKKPRLKTKWLFLFFLLLSLFGGLGGWFLVSSNKASEPVVVASTPKPSPTPVPTPVTKLSPLTGLAVAPDLADRPITAIVIENHPDARPQSGLSQAGVVYEALAEGGITRFLAFFGDQQAGNLGPVRSVRTYFVDWTLEFDAPLAHAGGNADALDLIGPLGMKNMDGLGIGAPTFYRTNDRYAPHNLYTSGALLDNLEAKFGFKQPEISVMRSMCNIALAFPPMIYSGNSYTWWRSVLKLPQLKDLDNLKLMWEQYKKDLKDVLDVTQR